MLVLGNRSCCMSMELLLVCKRGRGPSQAGLSLLVYVPAAFASDPCYMRAGRGAAVPAGGGGAGGGGPGEAGRQRGAGLRLVPAGGVRAHTLVGVRVRPGAAAAAAAGDGRAHACTRHSSQPWDNHNSRPADLTGAP